MITAGVIVGPTLQRDINNYVEAVTLADLSQQPTPVGAILAVSTKRISGAFNTPRNPPANVEFGQASYHAEVNCVKMVPERFRTKGTLYIARLNKSGEEMPSRPCPRCLKFLDQEGIRELVYFSDYGRIVKEYR